MEESTPKREPLTEARMLEIAREAGFIITTDAEAEALYRLGRAFEAELRREEPKS